jgi:hypothetical protein
MLIDLRRGADKPLARIVVWSLKDELEMIGKETVVA